MNLLVQAWERDQAEKSRLSIDRLIEDMVEGKVLECESQIGVLPKSADRVAEIMGWSR